jgi:hypothetical protein
MVKQGCWYYGIAIGSRIRAMKAPSNCIFILQIYLVTSLALEHQLFMNLRDMSGEVLGVVEFRLFT